jgi:EpsI family protein
MAALPEAAVTKRSHPGRIEHAIALAVLLTLMLGASIWMPRWSPRNAADLPTLDVPERIGAWVAIEILEPDWLYLGHVRFPQFHYRRYQHGGESVAVFVGYDDRVSRSRSLISPKVAFPGRGWEEEERAPVELGSGGLRAVGVVARSQSRRMLSYHWYQGTGGTWAEVLRAWLATDRSFLRRPSGSLVVRLSTEVSSIEEGRSRADTRLADLAELLMKSFADFGDGAGLGRPTTRQSGVIYPR